MNSHPRSFNRGVEASLGDRAITSCPPLIKDLIRLDRKLTIFHDELSEMAIFIVMILIESIFDSAELKH